MEKLRNQTRLLNTFFHKLPLLFRTVLGTLTQGGFTIDINSPDATTTCLCPFPSPAHFYSQQMLNQADHLTDLSGNKQRVIFQVCEQAQCAATWSVVPTVEGVCSWDLTSDSSLPRLALLRCETALSVRRPLKGWLKKLTTLFLFEWTNRSNDKNHRWPPRHHFWSNRSWEQLKGRFRSVCSGQQTACLMWQVSSCATGGFCCWGSGVGEEHKENCSTWVFSYSHAQQMLTGLCAGSVLVWTERLYFSRTCTRCKASSLIHRGVIRGVLFVGICLNRAAAES